MKNALLGFVLTVFFIQALCSKGIQVSLSGSKKCHLTVHLTANPVYTGYQSLENLNGRSGDPRYSLLDCRILSVKFMTGLGQKTSIFEGKLARLFTKKDGNRFQLILRDRNQPNHVEVLELDCKGKKCFLSSADNSKVKDKTWSSWQSFKRKLLGLKSDLNIDDEKYSLPLLSVWMTVAGVLTLIVTLAMCTCGRNSVEKTLSDEVGGTEFDQHVVGLSSVNKDQESKQLENQTGERRNTANSRETIAIKELNGGVNETTRTDSQSSQQGDSVGERTTRLESTGSHSSTKVTHASSSHGSVDNIEEISLRTTNPEPMGNNDSKDTRSFSQSNRFVYKGNEANIAAPGKNQAVHLISRKDSDKKDSKKDNKEHDGHVDHKSKRNWLRRKSSKTKSTSENQTSKDDKKKSPTGGNRHSALPLPPTPDTNNAPPYIEEELQYEAVEPRPRKPVPIEVADENYASVIDTKTTTTETRPASELYECINDDESKLNRNSSGSHNYDSVELKRKPPQVLSNPSSLEYAYAVVAPRDNLIKPSETSSGSGLYEVVTDDMKKTSGVTCSQIDDNDYAVVQKDKKSTKTNQATRPMSDTDLPPAPPPPPVSSLAAMSSVKVRAQSEGDNLNIIPDEPSSTHLLERPQTMFDVDHTYAKVNKTLKKRLSEKNDTRVFLPDLISDGDDNDSEGPPPIPPSLYAELPMTNEEPPPIPPSLYAELPMQNEGELESPSGAVVLRSTTVCQSSNSRESLNETNSRSSTDVTVFYNDYDTVVTKESITSIRSSQENVVTISVDAPDNQSRDALYQAIHYV